MSNMSDFLVGDAPDLGLMSVPALAPVASGDLVVFREVGGVSPYDPTIGPAVEANNTLGSKTVLAATLVGGGSAYGFPTSGGASSAVLSNGTVATIFTGDGTTATTNINFVITTAAGAIVVPATVVDTGGRTALSVHALPGGGFALLYGNTGTIMRMAIYSNAGAQVLAPVNIITDATSTSQSNYNAAKVLVSGNLAVAYAQTATGACILKVFDPAGAQVGSTITVEANGAPYFNCILQAPVSGDMIIVYSRTGASASLKVARYTLSGVQVGTLLALGSATSVFFGYAWNQHLAVVFGDDRVALLRSDDTNSSYAALSFLSTANTVTLTIPYTSLGNLSTMSAIPLIATDGDKLYYHQQTNDGTYMAGVWTSTGSGLVPPGTFSCATVLSIARNNQNRGYARLHVLGAAGFVVTMFGYDGSNYAAQNLYIPADRLSANTSVVSLYTSSTAERRGVYALHLGNGVIRTDHVPASSYASPSFAIFSYPRNAIFGIAQASAAAGEVVSVATKGTFALSTTQRSGGSANFDCRAYSVAGNKGTLAGASIVLLGIS